MITHLLSKKSLFLIASLALVIIILVILTLLSPRKDLPPDQSQLPEAKPQLFNNPETIAKGSLVVTTNQSDVRVVIDAPHEEVSTDTQAAPVNIAPFKISSIPAGKHTLTAFKEGFVYYEKEFEINPNQTTTIDIHLTPLLTITDPKEKWISMLPIKDQYYLAEYDRSSDSINVTLNPPPAVQVDRQTQVEFLKKVVIERLGEYGIDTNNQKINWINEQ